MKCRALLLAGLLLSSGVVHADIASDKAAALIVYPLIFVNTSIGIDTLVQVSNTSSDPVDVHCFYVDADGHCSNTGETCFSGATCGGGICLPGWNETDFRVRLTPQQPLAWQASKGLTSFPIDGTTRRGSDGSNNAGSRVPMVAENPFVGELKCFAVDDQGHPTDRNVLVGATTIEQAQLGTMDVVRDNAIGIPAVSGANNGDNTLTLGEEYSHCPSTLIVDHFFDGAIDPVSLQDTTGVINLVPCSEDFLAQIPSSVTAQFLVFNEFEQRFSTSTPVQCFGLRRLANIDTTQADKSIFSVGVEGTLTGQTRIRGVGASGSGLVGQYFDAHGRQSTAANINYQGESDSLDVIRIP